MLTSTPFNATRPDDGNARSVTEYPALTLNTVKCPGAIGGCFMGRKYGEGAVCTGSIGVGAGFEAVVGSELGMESFTSGDVCKGGLD
jgi:hypothetical protein